MTCTLLELFDTITQERRDIDYYQKCCLLETEEYLRSITSISDTEQKIIVSDCHEEPLNDAINEIACKTVEMDGLLVYYYIIHDDEFYFQKVKDYHELYDIMSAKLKNRFIGDLVVFENGKKKNYYVKNDKGKIVHYHWDERIPEEKIIEWY